MFLAKNIEPSRYKSLRDSVCPVTNSFYHSHVQKKGYKATEHGRANGHSEAKPITNPQEHYEYQYIKGYQ